jgi:hypothetical protein
MGKMTLGHNFQRWKAGESGRGTRNARRRRRRATETATAALWGVPAPPQYPCVGVEERATRLRRLPACTRQLGIFPPCLLTGSFWLFLACFFLKSILRPPPRPATQRPAFLYDTVMIKGMSVQDFHALSAGATAPCSVLEKTPKKLQ